MLYCILWTVSCTLHASPTSLSGTLYQVRWPIPDSFLIEFQLIEDLKIHLLGGTKRGTLADCKCGIPALSREAASVNHAYTLISNIYEPHRKGHGGNVFQKVLCRDGNGYDPLDSLRKQAERARSNAK